jgi:hypothetical protein
MLYARAARRRCGQARAAAGAREEARAVLSGILRIVGIFPDCSKVPLVRFPASSAFCPDSSARGGASEDAGRAREGSVPGRGERAGLCCVS